MSRIKTDIGTASQRHDSRSDTRDNSRLKQAFLLVLMHCDSLTKQREGIEKKLNKISRGEDTVL